MLHSFRPILALGAILAGSMPAHAAPTAPNELPCGVADVEYDLAATLAITDTVMGAGDGVHHIGPGRVVVRFDDRSGVRRASLLSYDLHESFTVVSSVLFWATRVKSDLQLRASPGTASVANGTMVGHDLRWDGRASGMRTDGTLQCEGAMCGKFGAPSSGTTEVHEGPSSIQLEPFQFSADQKTFAMPFAVISKSDSPRERTLLSIAGRQVQRACVFAPVGDS
jgi:hypothetical protein